jgi:hypothetical protein
MLQFEKVWNERTAERNHVARMIQQVDGTLTPGQIEALTQRAVYRANAEAGEIAGVTTASTNRVAALSNHCLYLFDCFIDPLSDSWRWKPNYHGSLSSGLKKKHLKIGKTYWHIFSFEK